MLRSTSHERHDKPVFQPIDPITRLEIQKILIVTDAWLPQVNGVVRTLAHVKSQLESQGHEVEVLGPDRFLSVPCPSYGEIRLALDGVLKLSKHIEFFSPDAIHIATEGPLGWTARHLCMKWNIPFTTAFHTRFPEYVRARVPVPLRLSYSVLRRFHGAAEKTLVPTASIRDELTDQGFKNLRLWSRGVEHKIFHPRSREEFSFDLPGPIHLYVGRIAVEKNIEAFLGLNLPGSKVIVGDGPARAELEKKYPDAHFLGVKKGDELAQCYSAADVFVFPSKSDTFGIVLLESLACGTPVAAYPVPGPKDVLNPDVGVTRNCLKDAIEEARGVSREKCAEYGAKFTWRACADTFLSTLESF